MSIQSISTIEINNQLHEVESNLNLMTIQILSATEPESLHNMFANSAQYAINQSKRIRRVFIDNSLNDMDLLAWSVRNLFETRLMLFRLMQMEYHDAMNAIVDELTRDDEDIYRGLMSSEAEYLTGKSTFPMTPGNAQMARDTGFETDYKKHYKFLCKYTHPTMYLLFYKPDISQNLEYANIMHLNALTYLHDIEHAIEYTVDNIPDGVAGDECNG